MNLYTLKQILSQSRHPSAPELYAEVSNHIDHFVNNDGDPEHARIVEPFALFILLNECTYNIYGQCRRSDDQSFEHYADRVRFYESNCLTDEQLKDAYDAMSDLWEDNEREKCNLPNGWFLSTQAELTRSLITILQELEGDPESLDEKLHDLLPEFQYELLKYYTEDNHDKH